MSTIEYTGPCVEASKARDKDGYVRCFYKGRNDVMHRAVWDLANGPIPEGMVVRHKCDNPACSNLTHLELGTHGDNAADRARRNPESWNVKGESNPKAKLTEAQVLEIRGSKSTTKELMLQFSASKTAITDIRAFRSWKYLTDEDAMLGNERLLHPEHAKREAAVDAAIAAVREGHGDWLATMMEHKVYRPVVVSAVNAALKAAA